MRKVIDGIIVVEGSNDASFLSSLIDAEYVVLNGLEIKNLNYLKKASEHKQIFLLTDSDGEGKRIRERVKKEIPTCVDIEVDIKQCNKKGKHGVFECNPGEIYRVFSNYFTDLPKTKCENNLCKISQSISVSKNPKLLREYLCYKLGIENCNNKTFIKRVALLNIKEEELLKLIKDFENGN